MKNREENLKFKQWLISDHILTNSIQYIREHFKPGDVFEEEALVEWAKNNLEKINVSKETIGSGLTIRELETKSITKGLRDIVKNSELHTAAPPEKPALTTEQIPRDKMGVAKYGKYKVTTPPGKDIQKFSSKEELVNDLRSKGWDDYMLKLKGIIE